MPDKEILPVVQGDIEAIARIIDPNGFRQWQSMYDYCLAQGDDDEEARATADWAHGKQKEDALAKATAIRSLASPPSVEKPDA